MAWSVLNYPAICSLNIKNLKQVQVMCYGINNYSIDLFFRNKKEPDLMLYSPSKEQAIAFAQEIEKYKKMENFKRIK